MLIEFTKDFGNNWKIGIYKLHERLRNLLPINGKSKNCPLLEMEV